MTHQRKDRAALTIFVEESAAEKTAMGEPVEAQRNVEGEATSQPQVAPKPRSILKSGPSAIALRLGPEHRARSDALCAWRRETFLLPREQALEKTWEWFALYPKDVHRTEIEFWRVREDGLIEFIMRRLSEAL